MRCDKSVTVTRTSRVTSRFTCHVTSSVTKRVSHATTTTPHHTVFMVSAVCGSFGDGSHSFVKAVEATKSMNESNR